MRKTAIFCAIAILFGVACSNEREAFTEATALRMCQSAFKKIAKDPDNADVPAVKNLGDSKEAYFAWGGETRVMHLRNGLGLEVAATGSCVVDMKTGKFTSITLNGESIL